MIRFLKGYVVYITSICIFYLLLFGTWVLMDKGHSFLAFMSFCLIHDYFSSFKAGFATFFLPNTEVKDEQ